MEISRRIYIADDTQGYRFYRVCVKHKIVEGLLVFALDSHAIYNKQGLLPFLSSLNRLKADSNISQILSLSPERFSVKFIDQVLPALRPYFSEVSQYFLIAHGLSMLDQTSQNLSNIMYYFCSYFDQTLCARFENFEMKYPNESVDSNKALRVQVMQDHLRFFYPSIYQRNRLYSHTAYISPPVSSVSPNLIPSMTENEIRCEMCVKTVRDNTWEYCDNMCVVCETCWNAFKRETCLRCPVCGKDQNDDKERIIQQRLCIFIRLKECMICKKTINKDQILTCWNGCKHCCDCYAKNGWCSKCLPRNIEEEKKRKSRNNIPMSMLKNESKMSLKRSIMSMPKKSKMSLYCCDHVNYYNRIKCKCEKCWKHFLENGNEGPTHCETCKEIYNLDLFQRLGDYSPKITCKYCNQDRFYRYIYELGDNTGDLICLDCLRSYELKNNHTKIKLRKDSKTMKKNSFIDCCRDYTKGPVTLCQSQPAHLNHTSHKKCVICSKKLIH